MFSANSSCFTLLIMHKLLNIFLFILAIMNLNCRSLVQKPSEDEIAGSIHVVKPGDTLAKLAEKYRISVEEIIDVNGIINERSLQIGQKLFMPDPDPVVKKIAQAKKSQPTPKNKTSTKNLAPTKQPIFDFPVPGGIIVHRFSDAKGKPYDGIGIKAHQGAKIIAPDDGRILFVGDEKTKFGLLVIVQHNEPFITVYAHLNRALVKTGQLIKRGQILGEVGKSGGIFEPLLHFQIRVKERPKNPELFLKS
jgi:murein DD-endopeptidase MepM/ murein hydrolase activator NlpD